MKKLFFLFVLLSYSSSNAQFYEYPSPNEGLINGGMGMNWIDGELYYSIHFFPEISFMNFGIGLDLNLDFNSKGKMRTENFNEFSDYLSIIRYVRYGRKNDPLFVKVGAIDYYTLGHGSIMYLYNNSPGFDTRKVGIVVDADLNYFGFESIYSSFSEASVAGLRGYIRPLYFTELKDIPIIGNLEAGATISGDLNENSGVVSGFYDFTQRKFISLEDKGSITAVGFDLALPLLRGNPLNVELYFDYAKLIDFGSGAALGIMADFSGFSAIELSAKLERRFNNDKYIHAYFGPLYELERFKLDTVKNVFTSKAQRLNSIASPGNGFYGELGVNLLGLARILGSYQRLDKNPKSGILHLSTDISPATGSFIARAGYDKINIRSEKDIFTLDDRSSLFMEIGYKPYPYMIVSMLYSWTFTPVRDKSDKVVDYQPQKRVEPRVSFIVPFNF